MKNNFLKVLSFLMVLAVVLACGNAKKNINMSKEELMKIHKINNDVSNADFFAVSEDSTWMLSVVFGESLVFTSTTDKVKFISTDATPQLAIGANIVQIVAENEIEKIDIHIDVQTCDDNKRLMSVSHTDKKSMDLKSYKGCGTYQGTADLFGTWELESINNEPLETSLFPEKLPNITIQRGEPAIGGFAGCNSYGGNIEFGFGNFTTKGVMSTKMYCEKTSAVENDFLSVISETKVLYSFKDKKLILESEKGSLIFNKVKNDGKQEQF